MQQNQIGFVERKIWKSVFWITSWWTPRTREEKINNAFTTEKQSITFMRAFCKLDEEKKKWVSIQDIQTKYCIKTNKNEQLKKERKTLKQKLLQRT